MAKTTLEKPLEKLVKEEISQQPQQQQETTPYFYGDEFYMQASQIERLNTNYLELLGEKAYKQLEKLFNESENLKGIGIFGSRRDNKYNTVYTAFIYFLRVSDDIELSRDKLAIPLGYRDFEEEGHGKEARKKSYHYFEKFVEDLTGDKPRPYDIESSIGGKSAPAVKQMIENHVDTS